jgi:hypothetical protein
MPLIMKQRVFTQPGSQAADLTGSEDGFMSAVYPIALGCHDKSYHATKSAICPAQRRRPHRTMVSAIRRFHLFKVSRPPGWG